MPARPANVAALGAEGHAEARHLHQAARQQGRLGVVAEAQAVADAGRDADDVLQRPGQLDADRVEVGVDAEAVGAEVPLDPAGQLQVVRWRRPPTSAGRG